MGCHTHREHGAAGTCRGCSLEFCEDCLVYAFGEGKQPYCVDCAVSAANSNSWDERRRVGGRA